MGVQEHIQRITLRTLLRLPERWLAAMSGDAPFRMDGNQLDARTRFLAAQGARGPSITTLTPAAARAATSAALALLDGPPPGGVTTREEIIPANGHGLRMRLYRPRSDGGPLPGLVFFHFGGFVIGDLETCHTFCATMAAEAGLAVASVEYRLAPEHRFPAAQDDARAAWTWITARAEDLGMDAARLGVGGDSAGGGLAACIAQEARQTSLAAPRLQLLIYPLTDAAWQGGSFDTCAQCYPLTSEIMEWFMGHFLNAPEEAEDVRVSPLRAADVSGVAPALVATAGFDPLRDQGRAYADKLQAAGVPVDYHCYGHLAHAFTAMTGTVPAARDACAGIIARTGRLLRQ